VIARPREVVAARAHSWKPCSRSTCRPILDRCESPTLPCRPAITPAWWWQDRAGRLPRPRSDLTLSPRGCGPSEKPAADPHPRAKRCHTPESQ